MVKAAAAAGAGAIVWAEPNIRGLANRPAYASAASNPQPYTVDLSATSLTLNAGVPLTSGGVTFTLVVTGPNPPFDTHTGTVTLTVSGCPCTITSTGFDLMALGLEPTLPTPQPAISGPVIVGGSLIFDGFTDTFTQATLGGAAINATCETP